MKKEMEKKKLNKNEGKTVAATNTKRSRREGRKKKEIL